MPARADLAAALERFHTRLSVELERLWEHHEPAVADRSVGIAALLTCPERFTEHLRFVASGGVQSTAPSATHMPEPVRLRVEASALGAAAEHTLDPAFVAPLCAALVGSGARVSAEACVVSAVVAMLQEELKRSDATPA